MKHLLIDALSVNNLSGRHVLVGHVRQLVAKLHPRYQFTVLLGDANAELASDFPEGVRRASAATGSGWVERTVWMAKNARRLCRELHVDAVFSPAGMLSIGCFRPQIVLAQNPWPLVPGMAKGTDAFKARLQCREFSRAQRQASLMVFNSRYMHDLYAEKLGQRERASVVAYQGIDEELFSIGAQAPELAQRQPMVLLVSVMARHKAVEVLVQAFSLIARSIPEAELVLAGSWPDASYRTEIESLIAQSGLSGKVKIEGHVEATTLRQLYGQARVFCLLSRCESFGIPAVEAQAFGTPVVVAEGTAAPEIVGAGGSVVPRDDAAATAFAIQKLMTDDAAWTEMSAAARMNAQRFHWQDCSAPLIGAVEELALKLE
jgi:glycosyltransferase involved in cell wall biosynthesis